MIDQFVASDQDFTRRPLVSQDGRDSAKETSMPRILSLQIDAVHRLPHPSTSILVVSSTTPNQQEVYRCNCSTCYKMNIFHVHPANPRDDFMLLSPLDPDHELSTYQCYDKELKFYFCPKCGVRCFTLVAWARPMSWILQS